MTTSVATPAPVLNARGVMQLLKLRIGLMIGLTALMGYLALAERPDVLSMLLLVLAMVLGSASSALVNHVYDRDIDRLMDRTCNRPFASGAIVGTAGALWAAAGLLSVGVALAMLAFNWVVALHLFLGAFMYGVVYTVWLKRRHWMNIVIGGAAGSFAVLAGAAAVDPSAWLLPWLMAVTLFLWTPSHFWALAILLKDEYAKAGVPMLPVLVGSARTAKAILINSVLLVGSSLLPWVMGELGWVYGVGALLIGARFLVLNVKLLRDPSPREARRTFLASMSYLGLLFLAVLLDRHLPVSWLGL